MFLSLAIIKFSLTLKKMFSSLVIIKFRLALKKMYLSTSTSKK